MAQPVEIALGTNSADATKVGSGAALPVQSPGRSTVTATITNGASLSGAIDLGASYMASRITMPAAWTAAGMTFQTSADGVTYNELKDNLQSAVSLTVAANDDFALDPTTFAGVRYLKIRSGTSGSPVNQGADRAIIITKVSI